MDFQSRLYRLRKEAGISQEQLADIVGVSRQAVQKWESGASRPDMDNLIALAGYFSVTLDYLIQGREALAPEPPARPRRCWPEYEYRSRRTLFGLPLVHIHFGYGPLCRAKGIFAFGNIAVGVVAGGSLSAGLISVGGLSAGGLAIGGLAAGILALGGGAIGLAALGGFALGLIAVGGGAVGLYAAGGLACGARMAVGNTAFSPCVAVGEHTGGGAVLELSQAHLRALAGSAHYGVSLEHTAELCAAHLPRTPLWLIRLLLIFGI